ncbi:MAG: hypothetical protein Q8P50_12310 [Bacillota bacterium]|nr:hypothetical protein [Bacillota bacterium]
MNVLSLVAVVAALAIVNEVAAIWLKITGMPIEPARFRALSALTGTGFTTSESELVVRHPSRRRALMVVMIAGRVGLAITAMMGSVPWSIVSATWNVSRENRFRTQPGTSTGTSPLRYY